jgi:hypothetical protein
MKCLRGRRDVRRLSGRRLLVVRDLRDRVKSVGLGVLGLTGDAVVLTGMGVREKDRARRSQKWTY